MNLPIYLPLFYQSINFLHLVLFILLDSSFDQIYFFSYFTLVLLYRSLDITLVFFIHVALYSFQMRCLCFLQFAQICLCCLNSSLIFFWYLLFNSFFLFKCFHLKLLNLLFMHVFDVFFGFLKFSWHFFSFYVQFFIFGKFLLFVFLIFGLLFD